MPYTFPIHLRAQRGRIVAFSHVLRGYMEAAGCSCNALAEACGLAPSTLSRYLTGARTPNAASLPADKMARALCEFARQAGTDLDELEIRENLLVQARSFPPAGAGRKLAALLDTFGITQTKLAASLGYSPSYVSRLCSQTRTPGSFLQFAQAAGRFFAERADSPAALKALKSLCPDIVGLSLEQRVTAWLCADEPATRQPDSASFLRKLDSFDLEHYIAALQFAESPNVAETGDAIRAPFTHYSGIEGFCEAELAFLAQAAAEPAGTSVVMFSDMPMQDKMDAVPGFPAAWVAALATLLRTGHTIENIHNVGRSLPEMMLGLEAWLPLYMTGMVTPYYLPSQQDGVLRHLIRCSQTVALEGQAVEGCYGHVGCQIFRDAEVVSHLRRRTLDLLSQARPLANIYTARNGQELAAFLNQQAVQDGERRALLSAPPLFTMDEELLERVLRSSTLDGQQAHRVREMRLDQLNRIETELVHGEVHATVAYVEPEGFDANTPNVALGETFCPHSVSYDAQTYHEHVEQTRRFAESHPAWHLIWGPDLGFRNIQLYVKPDSWALVSKNTSPAIHFVLRHKKMVEAFSQFEMPVTTQHSQA